MAQRTFPWVFVFSPVLEHGWKHVLVAYCSSPRAGSNAWPIAGAQGPAEGVPSTAARVAMEMRAAVKGRNAA